MSDSDVKGGVKVGGPVNARFNSDGSFTAGASFGAMAGVGAIGN
jgi:hypothetical protein